MRRLSRCFKNFPQLDDLIFAGPYRFVIEGSPGRKCDTTTGLGQGRFVQKPALELKSHLPTGMEAFGAL